MQQSQHHTTTCCCEEKLQCFHSSFLSMLSPTCPPIESQTILKMFRFPKFYKEIQASSVFGLDPYNLSASLKIQHPAWFWKLAERNSDQQCSPPLPAAIYSKLHMPSVAQLPSGSHGMGFQYDLRRLTGDLKLRYHQEFLFSHLKSFSDKDFFLSFFF